MNLLFTTANVHIYKQSALTSLHIRSATYDQGQELVFFENMSYTTHCLCSQEQLTSS